MTAQFGTGVNLGEVLLFVKFGRPSPKNPDRIRIKLLSFIKSRIDLAQNLQGLSFRVYSTISPNFLWLDYLLPGYLPFHRKKVQRRYEIHLLPY